jgi:hypothetical protein
MDFAQFCKENGAQKKCPVVRTLEEIGVHTRDSLRNKEINRIRELTRGEDFEVVVDTFFVKLEVRDLKLISYCPDDEAWLLGHARRGVWLAIDDNVIYVIAKEKKFEENARKVSHDIAKAMKDIFGDDYTVTGCWAM